MFEILKEEFALLIVENGKAKHDINPTLKSLHKAIWSTQNTLWEAKILHSKQTST